MEQVVRVAIFQTHRKTKSQKLETYQIKIHSIKEPLFVKIKKYMHTDTKTTMHTSTICKQKLGVKNEFNNKN